MREREEKKPLRCKIWLSYPPRYTADLKDDGREITCVSTQLDHDGRTVLYELSTSLRLRVEKIVLPVDNALTQKIGIISGVLLAVIFLILLLVFCVFVVCKRCRRRRRRPHQPRGGGRGKGGEEPRPLSSHTESSEASPESTLKPIWTTTGGGGGRGSRGGGGGGGRGDNASSRAAQYEGYLDGSGAGLQVITKS